MLHILLALSHRERHGYDIMKQVEEDSSGSIRLGPGTLYGAIKRMLQDELIEETEERDAEDERRRVYRLTKIGRTILKQELTRMEDVVHLAQRRKLLPLQSPKRA